MTQHANSTLTTLSLTAVIAMAMVDAAAYAYHGLQAQAAAAAIRDDSQSQARWQQDRSDPLQPELDETTAEVLEHEREVTARWTGWNTAAMAKHPCRTFSIAYDARYPVAERIQMLRQLDCQLGRESNPFDQMAFDMADRAAR